MSAILAHLLRRYRWPATGQRDARCYECRHNPAYLVLVGSLPGSRVPMCLTHCAAALGYGGYARRAG